MNTEVLNIIREQSKKALAARLGEGSQDNFQKHVLVCGGTGCHSSGCQKVYDKMEETLKATGLDESIKLIQTGCMGACQLGPVVMVYPGEYHYCHVGEDDVSEIVEKHLKNDELVERLFYTNNDGELQPTMSEMDFYRRQQKIALRNCGKIDPTSFEEYLAVDGFKALEKVLTSMKPQEVIDVIKASGLRGRGGAGFPTGVKWQFMADNESDEKYVICNGDEGDPGAFMDNAILTGDPFSIIEAMTICGYATGATKGYAYIRLEYPLAIKNFRLALEACRKNGLLGENILDSGFSFDIEVREGAGAFVCGEETALMASIEGKRGEPRPRPPFPAASGLYGKPSNINNVETWANVCPIILNGPEWYANIGVGKSKGTKVFALAGKIVNAGLVEVPMGISLKEVVEEIGGGIADGKAFKAAQTGGPSGGCIPIDYYETSLDYETLAELGSIVGSGGLIITDEDTCMVDLAKFYLTFTQEESCGKCTSCRIGTKRMLEIMDRITKGLGTEEDLALLEELAYIVQQTALCGLGQTAPNPIVSTLQYYRDEYLAHIIDKECPAGVCDIKVKKKAAKKITA
ncbi:MAG: NADH-quinone oxidoreductase subunit F [Firmicutes bacterium]|nr:NADH-quinone oxidoreductase subunit F [Bacillota bacterium]